jgi:hypothetical protein
MNGPTDVDVARWLDELESDDPAYRMEALGKWAEGWRERAGRAETALRRIRDHGQTHDEPCWKIANGDCADVMQEIARSVIGDRP